MFDSYAYDLFLILRQSCSASGLDSPEVVSVTHINK